VILLIDNYDSFVYNLARYLREIGCQTSVVRNDALSVADVVRLKPQAIVLSPGPGTPDDAGICLELVEKLIEDVPVFGVCLGHQAIARALGADIVRAPEVVHGRTSMVTHDGSSLFAGIPSPFRATRYHSLIVDESTLSPSLQVTARSADGLVMALAHDSARAAAVQFHPESILTDGGHRLLANFLQSVGIETHALPPASARETPPIDPLRTALFNVPDAVDWSDDRGTDSLGTDPLHW